MASEQALRDQNYVTSLLLESNATPGETVRARGDASTGRLLVDFASGGGDVVGPGASTDDAVVRWNGTTGIDIANSTIGLSDAGILYPFTNDTGQLGDATHSWSDLFLATGAVINYANGNVTITHSSGTLTVAGALTVSGVLRSNTSLVLEETGAGTDTITIQAPNSIAASYTLTLPVDDGDNLQVLQTNGSGVLSWVAQSSFTLTVGAVSPVTSIQFVGASVGDSGGGVATVTVTSQAGGSNTQLQYNNSGAFGGITGATTNGTVVTLTSALATTAFSPSSNDGAALGSGTASFADLFLATGGVINWANGNTTITHSTGLLTTNVPVTVTGVVTGDGFAPTSTTATGNRLYLPAANTLGWAINGSAEMQLTSTALSPAADGGNSLGTTTLGWQNLFGNTGFVINLENSDWVATHTAGILTVGTGDLRVTNAGVNTTSVVTVGGTQTLTNKTLTAPTLGGVTSFADGATFKFIVPTVDGTATGPTTSAFVSGYTSSAIGDLVILDSNGKWQKTDANTTSIYNGMVGIALAVAATDAALLVALPGSIVYATAFPTMTIGAAMYMSETAATITATAPTTTDSATRLVGYAVHADKLFFFPSNDWITHT